MKKLPLSLALAACSLLVTGCIISPCSGCGHKHSQAPIEHGAPVAIG